MKPIIVIIGAGGHGKVILDCIIAQGQYEVAGFVDAGHGRDCGGDVLSNFAA